MSVIATKIIVKIKKINIKLKKEKQVYFFSHTVNNKTIGNVV